MVEVGPRDGLQNEPRPVPTEAKVEFIRRLAAAGCREIEATSFVRPDRVPQLADAEAVIAALRALQERGELAGVRLSALVPNEKGLERALVAGVRRIAVFTAASEAFARRNLGMGIAESLRTFASVVRRAAREGVTARGYVSTAFACPFEGEIAPERVREVALGLLEAGVDEVSLGDTIGVAAPTDVFRLLEALLPAIRPERLALHFHDTSGTALANTLAGLEAGIRAFDSAAGGLGGCPFAPGAAGNLATEDLLYMLGRMGIAAGVSLEGVAAASTYLEPFVGHPLPSRQLQRLRARASNRSDVANP